MKKQTAEQNENKFKFDKCLNSIESICTFISKTTKTSNNEITQLRENNNNVQINNKEDEVEEIHLNNSIDKYKYVDHNPNLLFDVNLQVTKEKEKVENGPGLTNNNEISSNKSLLADNAPECSQPFTEIKICKTINKKESLRVINARKFCIKLEDNAIFNENNEIININT